jgi:hypothetical protein
MSMTSATIAWPAAANITGKSKSVASVPGNQTPRGTSASDPAIWRRAYQKWEAAGNPAGDGVRFWSEAKREILQGM